MNAYLIEAHRPSATWEKQTRLVYGRTLAEAADTVEIFGLIIDQAITLTGREFAYSKENFEASLSLPWKTRESR